jgi:hypothetical protein
MIDYVRYKRYFTLVRTKVVQRRRDRAQKFGKGNFYDKSRIRSSQIRSFFDRVTPSLYPLDFSDFCWILCNYRFTNVILRALC